MKVKLTKIAINKDSEAPQSKTIEEYRNGKWDKSPPVDYWLLGELLEEIEVGKPLRISRWNRNGLEALGMFHSTPVVTLHEHNSDTYITTNNSVYKMELLED